MSTQVLTVSFAPPGTATGKPIPKIAFKSGRLPSMGFQNGVLVKALPVPNGMDFILCDENIQRFSELAISVKEQGGKLIQVILNADSRREIAKYPHLVTSGQYICGGGLSIGDTLIAQYSYGLIQTRKIVIDGNARLFPVGSVKEKDTDLTIPKVHLNGYWLADCGFPVGALSTAAARPGSMTFQFHDTPYTELVPYARRNRLKVVQIRENGNQQKGPIPFIGVSGSYVTIAGFGLGDMLIADCAPGLIKVTKLDLAELGLQSQTPLS